MADDVYQHTKRQLQVQGFGTRVCGGGRCAVTAMHAFRSDACRLQDQARGKQEIHPGVRLLHGARPSHAACCGPVAALLWPCCPAAALLPCCPFRADPSGQAYGPADHAKTVELLKTAFPDYADISFTNEGY